jgi:G:T-mismatch repair DNA endonuclease (very short patch repair protein)
VTTPIFIRGRALFPCQGEGCSVLMDRPRSEPKKFHSPECRKKSYTGGRYVRGVETREKLFQSMKNFNASEEVLAKRSETMKSLYREGKTHSVEANAKISVTMKRLHADLTEEERFEARRKNAEGLRRAWSEGKFSNRKPGIRPRASKQELSLAPILEPLGYRSTFENPYYIKCSDKTRVPDYVNTRERKVLEYFGSFWHPNPLEDILIRRMYEEAGWECIVVWENDLEYFRDLLGVSAR